MFATATLVVLTATFQPTVSERFAGSQGEVQLETGVLSEPLGGKLEQSVLLYALQQRDALKLPVTSSLSKAESFGTRFGASFHLKQLVDGIEVDGAKVVVTVDRLRRVVQLSSSVKPYARVSLDWTLSIDDARERAALQTEWAMRAPDGKAYGGVKRKVFVIGDEARAGYLVWVPSLDLRHNWYFAIDAETGATIWRRDRAFKAEHDADVYPSSPGAAGVGAAPTQRVTLSHFGPDHADGGFLFGDQITTANCCVNENCSTATGAKPKRATGTTNAFGFPVPYNMAVCDRRPLATNDVNVHPSGDFVYAPQDPPKTSAFASQLEPADVDPFVEVHAYYHVNGVYDFVRGLSTAAAPLFPNENVQPFQMRDEKVGKRPAVWTNVLLPDFQQAQSTLFATGTATADNLVRVDNAAFMAKENFDSLLIPELSNDVDTLMIFQGNGADFGYDAPVLWHEFGHGVIYSTAAFESFTLDARSGNNEGGALHEGIADYLAAAFGKKSVIGEYVGPRTPGAGGMAGGALRDLENTLACPDVLWGEVHQDSQHFSAALWQARKELFQGTDEGSTFDAAFYASLVSMTPETDFAQAAAIISNHVKLAFPSVQDADGKMSAIFDARGVTNCSKVVDLTGSTTPRPYYGIGGSQVAGLAQGQLVPGPYQMKISVPQGAQRLSITATPMSQDPFGGGNPGVRVLAKADSFVSFARSGTQLTNDADATGNLGAAGQSLTVDVDVAVPCGGDLYFTLGSVNPGGATLANVTWNVVAAESCPEPDAGTGTDGGMEDAGVVPPAPLTLPAVDGNGTDAGGTKAPGCGCNAVDPSLAAFGLLGLLALARRRAK